MVEFGEEVSGTRRFGLLEVAHDVCPLLPHLDGLLQLHLTLDDEHVDHSRVRHVSVPVEHFSNLLPTLLCADVQLVRMHCVRCLSVPGPVELSNSPLGLVQVAAEKRFHHFSGGGACAGRCARRHLAPLRLHCACAIGCSQNPEERNCACPLEEIIKTEEEKTLKYPDPAIKTWSQPLYELELKNRRCVLLT